MRKSMHMLAILASLSALLIVAAFHSAQADDLDTAIVAADYGGAPGAPLGPFDIAMDAGETIAAFQETAGPAMLWEAYPPHAAPVGHDRCYDALERAMNGVAVAVPCYLRE